MENHHKLLQKKWYLTSLNKDKIKKLHIIYIEKKLHCISSKFQ